MTFNVSPGVYTRLVGFSNGDELSTPSAGLDLPTPFVAYMSNTDATIFTAFDDSSEVITSRGEAVGQYGTNRSLVPSCSNFGGKSSYFDGSTDLTTTINGSLPAAGNWSLEMWFCAENVNSTLFVSKPWGGTRLEILVNGNGEVRASNGILASGGTPRVDNGEPQHFVVTRNGNSHKAYHNGISVGYGNTGANYTEGGPFVFGNKLQGQLIAFAYYNRVLSESEIQEHYSL